MVSTVKNEEIKDPSDSMMILVPAPFLGVETLVLKMTSSGEIHAICGNQNFIFTRPVVNRDGFVDESLFKMMHSFKLPVESVYQLKDALVDFLEYTRAIKEGRILLNQGEKDNNG